MAEPSTCWTCGGPYHDGAACPKCPACPHPVHSGRCLGTAPDGLGGTRVPCRCNSWRAAEATAATSLQHQHDVLAERLKLFVGYQLRGHINGEWSVRTPKGHLLTAVTPNGMYDAVAKDAGSRSRPAQVEMPW